ncbi:hypothetical protein D3I93_02260 [Serratia marcescens]|uniref:hypothetical protein n=1 Tax=Serratia marcescens TaxID=615 RepID=UPI000E726D14|nr:hypothetical protein [Serratia marcescens]RJY02620.1 hypothetical protein D3I93_02260 [Serratia marcescens]
MTTIQRFTPDYKMHAVRFEAFAREAEHGECAKFDAHQRAVSALEAERDALAVENQALSAALSLISGSYGLSPHIQSMCAVDTPTTDAAVAAIQAQGVEKFADDLHKVAMAMCSVKPDNTAPGAYAGMARSFAKKLREAK